MKAKSIKGSSPEELRSALKQSMADGYKPTLGIIFISVKQDRKVVAEILQREGIDILGATSSGEFINGYQGEGSIVILLLDLHRDAYRILFEDAENRSSVEAARMLAEKALQAFKRPAFILCSTGVSTEAEFFDGEGLVHSIEKLVGSHVNLFGGMAGDDGKFAGTYVFTHEKETDWGIAALILDEDRINLYGVAISGWKPLGTLRTVTKSEDGWLYTIDGKPALEMYLRHLGKAPVAGDGTPMIFEDIGFYYPFLALDAGDPVIRTPLMVSNEKNAIKLDFPIPEGKKLQFSMPPDFDIIEDVLDNATELKNSSQSDAEALLIFSCFGRLSALGPMISSENDGLHEIWRAPMAGFFTYGEYGKGVEGKQHFHSTTCSWVALKEK